MTQYQEGRGNDSPSHLEGNDSRNHGPIGSKQAMEKPKEEDEEVTDPLPGMAAVDKWGIKGLRTLMHNYPDYQSMIVGIDPGQLGLDLTSQEYVQFYKLINSK